MRPREAVGSNRVDRKARALCEGLSGGSLLKDWVSESNETLQFSGDYWLVERQRVGCGRRENRSEISHKRCRICLQLDHGLACPWKKGAVTRRLKWIITEIYFILKLSRKCCTNLLNLFWAYNFQITPIYKTKKHCLPHLKKNFPRYLWSSTWA